MVEPAQMGGAQEAGARPCHYCGTTLGAGALYCAECDRYQPDPEGTEEQAKTVARCNSCHELIPRGAHTCNHCNTAQRGIGSWLPTSSNTLAALSTLVSLVVLLLNTVADWEPSAYSKTDLELFDAGLQHLYVRLNNEGTMPAFAGRAWFRLAPDCGWQGRIPDDPEPCATLATEPQLGVLELKAPRETAVAKPGPTIATYLRQGDFDAVNPMPASLDCANFEATIAPLKACFSFEIIEHRQAERRCLVREVSNLSGTNLTFVKDATCK